MKKKIAIITFHAVSNHGSVLQTFATKKKLESKGLEVEIINFKKEECRGLLPLIKFWNQDVHNPIKKFVRGVILFPSFLRWKYMFARFLRKYIDVDINAKAYTTEEDFKHFPLNADIYCVGSDQVWNSVWNNGILKPLFLTFIPNSYPKVSYSSSFGRTELKEEDFQKALSWTIDKKKEDFENFNMNSVSNLFRDTPDLYAEVVESLSIANQLAFVLSKGLHGNPRQCKRFLNSMYMRLQMASYKNKKLDRKILAKIMMLEYIKPRIFNKIAEMAANNTLSEELEFFENGAPEKADELKIWKEDTWFLNWCKIVPKLSCENLNIYFYFTRTSLDEKISRISSVLSPMGKNILDLLMSKSDIKIRQAIEQSKNLSDSEAALILETMNSSMLTETTINKETMKAFLLFAQQRTELLDDTISYLQSFSGSQISLGCIGYIASFAKDTSKQVEIREIVSKWAMKKPDLQSSIEKLLKNKS